MAVKRTEGLPRQGRRSLLFKILSRFAGHQEGSAAVEFSIVVIPLLALVFATIETALILFASETMETAVADASRLIMTGQAKAGNFDKAKFKDEVCKRLVAMFDCQAGVQIDVQTYASFAAADTGKPLDADGKLKTNFAYQPGCPGDIVVVRTMYLWPVYASVFGYGLADMAGNKRLLMATAAFRNEPYSATCS
jgi:Flp pilus assembly protein TadG